MTDVAELLDTLVPSARARATGTASSATPGSPTAARSGGPTGSRPSPRWWR